MLMEVGTGSEMCKVVYSVPSSRGAVTDTIVISVSPSFGVSVIFTPNSMGESSPSSI